MPDTQSPSSDLSRALVLYLGRGTSSFPTWNATAVMVAFGAATGEELVARIREVLAADSVISDEHYATLDTATLLRRIMDAVREQFPTLSSEALEAVDWHFSYQYQ
jgi:hypothetical protein